MEIVNVWKMDQQSQKEALSRMQDSNRVEEKSSANVDAALVQKALGEMKDAEKKAAEAEAKKVKELGAVKINKEDVKAIVEEFELEDDKAETVLREHGGDLKATLRHLVLA